MTSNTPIGTHTVPLADQVVLNALPYAAIICDRNGKVLQCNEAIARMIGVSKERMLGTTAGFLSKGLLNDIEDVFASGRSWRGDIVLVSANNDSHVCDLSIAPLEYFQNNETRTAVLMTLLENDRQKQAERSLMEQNRNQSDANASKSDFIANMGHELRTPLNAIIGNSELIAEGVLGDITDGYRDCGRDVFEAGKHLLELVNNVLDVSKLSAGSMTLQLNDEDLVCVIKEATKLAREDISRHQHSLHFNIAETPVPMRCDKLKIKQILINILSNAAKFTPDGGVITVDLAQTDKDITISIADTGVGMSPNDIPRAFARFAQLHPSGVKESTGTGLGLPLAKLLVELHGGRMSIESALGKGTTVGITLPRL
ncbi:MULTISPECIES: PAS domain-containing sensor histidine kinase [Thalassospira]|uniref:histidine kinase n=1 Tax=Thalassospira lucentensis TaxID=168935 RepID=A0A358HQ77_9PROT|nr:MULTISPECIES: ATP-binding protein [Thalassospira]HBU96914.1 PAS domain-containing protein [Thalassospira lucentensis]HCW66114.1 PAS domain-containing protein [Thalassospira lucentensis]